MVVNSKSEFVRRGLTIAMIALAGCAWMQNPGGGASSQQVSKTESPPPMVQDCGIVTIGSPTKYACHGKTYTSFDLAKLRLDWEKNHGG